MALQAVLTGDIVNSTKLDSPTETQLLQSLNEVLTPYQFEFYRGDSFQVYLADAGLALKTALLCRTAAIAVQQGEETTDLRISIGIGEVSQPVDNLGAAKGEAFLLSGRSFDEIQKTETRLAISCQDEWGKLACTLAAGYINSIFNGITAKQAEVIFLLLQGETQQKISEKINKSKSTISQFASAGKWNEIEQVLVLFDQIIHKLNKV